MTWIGRLNFKTWYNASCWPFFLWVAAIGVMVIWLAFSFEFKWSIGVLYIGATLFHFYYYHRKYQQYEKWCDRHRELIKEHRTLNGLEW